MKKTLSNINILLRDTDGFIQKANEFFVFVNTFEMVTFKKNQKRYRILILFLLSRMGLFKKHVNSLCFFDTFEPYLQNQYFMNIFRVLDQNEPLKES